ncbi:transcription initiation factor TFIID 23-30 kDa subunit, putative [Babesia ovata]|uniref:Transcription initiation factor TFIID 23-30 kDa subunit, putative n=1 Tax=Babesia ovata TaxID=189622 RepID=A0A2H6K9Y3_9APIC|nr:transcription initiation factor TFIID 23-30 kDa subunit, putative [Babesia ovata]GBE59759.1 transcription initiation factor TFIID 23-30 kDa subunit, putative [Babesia ovata]
MSRNGAPNIQVDVLKGLSQPSALHDELVRYILSTVGCKLHNESTLRLVSHAAQMALEKFITDAKNMQMIDKSMSEGKVGLLSPDEIRELDYQVIVETMQKTEPKAYNYSVFLEPNMDF